MATYVMSASIYLMVIVAASTGEPWLALGSSHFSVCSAVWPSFQQPTCVPRPTSGVSTGASSGLSPASRVVALDRPDRGPDGGGC